MQVMPGFLSGSQASCVTCQRQSQSEAATSTPTFAQLRCI